MRYFRNGECIALAPHCDIYVYTPTRPPAIIFWIFIGFACSYFYGSLYLWVVAQKKHPAVLYLKKEAEKSDWTGNKFKKIFFRNHFVFNYWFSFLFFSYLQQSSSTVFSTAFAVHNFTGYTANIIVVIPRQFTASSNVRQCEKGDPWKSQIVCIDEHILYE